MVVVESGRFLFTFAHLYFWVFLWRAVLLAEQAVRSNIASAASGRSLPHHPVLGSPPGARPRLSLRLQARPPAAAQDPLSVPCCPQSLQGRASGPVHPSQARQPVPGGRQLRNGSSHHPRTRQTLLSEAARSLGRPRTGRAGTRTPCCSLG